LAQAERRLAAIMFTDIVGYTALTQSNEALALELLKRHRELIRPALSRHGGREVKTMGDAFLVEFASALEAIECAMEMQKILHEYNRVSNDKLKVRIGIHVGDVVHTENDEYGDAVNIASRIEPLAQGGEICISEHVYGQVRNKVSYPMVKLPGQNLKNVEFPIDVYKMVLPVDQARPDSIAPTSRIAVLPLTNISLDPKDGYFADGMTEELITALSQVQGLRVIARTSVENYRARDKRVSQIGKELEVGSVMEGSVRMAGDRLRITVQLIDAKARSTSGLRTTIEGLTTSSPSRVTSPKRSRKL
jgi:class 3 adenylate cyclase